MRIFPVFLALILCASCQKNRVDPEPKQTLHLNLWDDPVSFDPRLVRTLKDLTVVKQLYEGLTRVDADGTPQLAVAEETIISDDLLTYTFKLRETYWNNHNPVTAFDFVAAWQEALDPSFASDYSYMLYPIKNARSVREGKMSCKALGVHAPDAQTLIVELESPTPYFLELAAFPTYYPFHTGRIQEGAFNGPFQLHNWIPSNMLVFEKNPAYWDADSVKLQRLLFSIIPDNSTESLLFEKGKLDWLGMPLSQNISTDLLENVSEKYSYPVAGTFWLKFNTLKEPFDDPKIRLALSYTINRSEIIFHILHGGQKVATSLLPSSMALNETPFFKDGDVTTAKQLFYEALKERNLTVEALPPITLCYSLYERNAKIAQLIQQQWESALGIDVELAAFDYHLFRRNISKGLFQIATGEWIGDFNDPIAFLELFKSGNNMNDTGWINEEYNSLLDQSLLEIEPEKRTALLRQAEETLMLEMPIAPIYHYAFDYVRKESVHDVILSPLGLADFKIAFIQKD